MGADKSVELGLERGVRVLFKLSAALLLTFHPLFASGSKLRPYPGWHVGSWESDSGKIKRRLRRAMWERCKKPRVIRWLDGLRVYIYPGNETSRTLLLSGLYEPNELYWLKSSLAPGQTFIDIGANMGVYTIFAAKGVGPRGTVVAIEPSTRDFVRLKANVELNKMANVQLLQVAVSNHEGEADLRLATDEHSGHNTLGDFGYPIPSQGKQRVRVMRLDDIVQQLRLTRLDVIKMDVEGAEYAALQGATDTIERFKPSILLELSDRTLVHQGASGGRIWDFLTRMGYSVSVFDRETGLASPGARKEYFDSENVIATRSCSPDHHSIFRQYGCWSGAVPPRFAVNFLGVRTRETFTTPATRDPASTSGRQGHVATKYPPFDEEYFEWIDVLESIAGAEKQYVVIELGAGYGRWLVNAATALGKKRQLAFYLIGVEAEPSHFNMMKQHFRDNDLDPDEHLLVQAAVAAKDGNVHFFVGHSQEWYGQCVAPHPKAKVNDYPNARAETVKAISLKTLLRQLDHVDLVDLDVQGQEYEVLKAATDELNAKVKRIHIGTHGRTMERNLRRLFRRLGWCVLNDYPMGGECMTPYGKIRFKDGVQTWLNEKLCGKTNFI